MNVLIHRYLRKFKRTRGKNGYRICIKVNTYCKQVARNAENRVVVGRNGLFLFKRGFAMLISGVD